MRILIHCIVWGIISILPLFATSQFSNGVNRGDYLRHLIVIVSFLITFYVNYSLLVKRFLLSHRVLLFVIFNVLLIAIMMTVTSMILQNLLPHPSRPVIMKPLPGRLMFVFRNAGMYLMVTGAAVAIKVTEGWYAAESERRELERSRTEAELQNLKNQLNPHFLFNTLNNIYSLIGTDSDKARKAVHDLSHLLRYVLYESSRPSVPISSEMNFLQEYVNLMRIRLPRNTALTVSFPENCSVGTPHDPASPAECTIAPLLFISLIENAFKHGVCNEKDSYIDISIKLQGQLVACDIKNSCFPKSPATDRSGSGIGIANLQKRLEMIYPGKFRFEHGQSGETYKVHLEIDTSIS